MWIIPKNIPVYHFVQDMEGLNSDLNELARMCEQSLMWRSKPSLARTWSQRWNRVSWMQHLFGRILKPSMRNRFEIEYTSSLPVIRASHSVSQGSDKEQMTPDTFGRILNESFRQLDLFGSSEKTSQDTLQLDSPKFIEAYELWVTKLRQDYLERWNSVFFTTENGYLSLPTPTATMGNLSKNCQLKKGRFVTIRKGTNLQYGASLTNALEINQPEDLVSNPSWIEELMGLPVGWTDCDCLEMVSSHSRRKKHLEL